jgi:hypothetical protein
MPSPITHPFCPDIDGRAVSILPVHPDTTPGESYGYAVHVTGAPEMGYATDLADAVTLAALMVAP